MIEEVWKDVKHYEGLYQVSNFGRVKSLGRWKDNHSKKQWVEEKYLIQRNNGRGYLAVDLNKNNKTKREYVHRLVALTFIPNPEHKPQVDHIDTDRQNNRVENLRWVTQRENNFNPITHKRMCEANHVGCGAKGEKNGANTHPEKNNFINDNPGAKMKGMCWFNNGTNQIRAFECPEGFVKGML